MSPDQLLDRPTTAAPPPVATTPRRSAVRRACAWWALAAVATFGYLTVGIEGDLGFVLDRRLRTVATMFVVGVAVGVATVLFHTVTANRILTPSIMGLDALYLLVQTGSVVVLGVSGAVALDPLVRFAAESLAMTALAVALYQWLLVGAGRSLHLVVLVGVVVGGLFRSLSTLLQRAMDPTQFLVLQDRFFADFHSSDPRLLALTAVLVAALVAAAWTGGRHLDVLSLGRAVATGLGLRYRRVQVLTLTGVSVLVAASTALVGPTSFFGLLVAHLVYRTLGTLEHRVVLPAVGGAAVAVLVGGQLVLEQALGLEGSLSLVVELLGGIVFLALLLRKARV